MFRGSKKAQSVLEYVIVLSAIVALILYAANTWFGPTANTNLGKAANAIEDAADQIAK
jgi:hypothetical protein